MTLLDRLEKKATNWQPIASVVSASSLLILLAATISQCSRIDSLQAQLTDIRAAPVVVQFGVDKNAALTTAVPQKENMKEFAKEIMPLLRALTAELPEEIQKECQPKCEQLAQGQDVPGVGKVPTLPYLASSALTEEYQKPYLLSLTDEVPEDIEQGGARLYTVKAVSDPVPIEDRPKEYQLYVVGSQYTYAAGGVPLYGIEQDYKVSVREIAPPKTQEKMTPLQERVAVTRSRGFEITMIEPVEKNRDIGLQEQQP
jgi:hypothetical protein